MKKTISSLIVALACCISVQAQGIFSENLFNHFSVGVTAGTTGFGLEAAATAGNYFQVRAGFSMLPGIKYGTDLDVSGLSQNLPETIDKTKIPNKFDVEGKLNITDFSFLIDYYPFKSSSFFVTAGFFVGKSQFIEVYNEDDGALLTVTNANKDIDTWNNANPGNQLNNIGLELGDYLLTADEKGNVNANIETASFKPYLGIGFGRAVTRTKKLGFKFELGCQFWGTPKVYCNDIHLESSDVDGDAGDILKTLSDITIYPVLKFALNFRVL